MKIVGAMIIYVMHILGGFKPWPPSSEPLMVISHTDLLVIKQNYLFLKTSCLQGKGLKVGLIGTG